MFQSIVRIIQRHLIPGFVATLVHLIRSGAMVNPSSRVQISRDISLGKGTVVKAFAVIQSTGGTVRLGKDCAVGNFNHISAAEGGVLIGDHVRMGPNVTILAMTNITGARDKLIIEQGYRSKGIVIGNDVFIGAGATILDGVQIGDGAVVGVNSLVTKKVKPYSVVYGSPAKAIFNRA